MSVCIGGVERRGVGREVDLVEVVLHAFRVLLGHVVVPVDERRFAEDPPDAVGLGARGQWSEDGQQRCQEQRARGAYSAGHDHMVAHQGPLSAAGPCRMRLPATGTVVGCNRVRDM